MQEGKNHMKKAALKKRSISGTKNTEMVLSTKLLHDIIKTCEAYNVSSFKGLGIELCFGFPEKKLELPYLNTTRPSEQTLEGLPPRQFNKDGKGDRDLLALDAPDEYEQSEVDELLGAVN